MIEEKEVVASDASSERVFTADEGFRKIRAGNMSMIVGVAETTDTEEEFQLEEDTFPEVPAGGVGDYDSWL